MTEKKRCDHCGELKEDVVEARSPYIAEVDFDRENPKTLWCEDCLQKDFDQI